MTTKKPAYNADDLTALEGLDAVRKRPGMYVGELSSRGMTHLAYEILDNAVDEALAGHCTKIWITLHEDGSLEIADNGRGIPVDVNAKTGMSGVLMVFTKLHAGGKFGGSGYKAAGGLHGVGASVVNALSERVDVLVYRDGKKHEISFHRGTPGAFDAPGPKAAFKPSKDIRQTGATKRNGTIVRFWPDFQIFHADARMDHDAIVARARQTAFLVPNVEIEIRDRRDAGSPTVETFHFSGGIKDMVTYLAKDKPICDPIYITGSGTYVETVPVIDEKGHMAPQEVERTVDVQVALLWGNGYDPNINSFANVVRTPNGGTHVKGFERALVAALRKGYEGTRILRANEEPPTLDDAKEGLTAVISIGAPEVQFLGQTKDELATIGVQKAVQDVVAQGVKAWIDGKKKAQARVVLEKVANAARTRIASRTQREAARRKTALEGASMPAKLVDCRAIGVDRSEIFLVEGDSALGCFTGETLVATAEGTAITFEQLVADWANGIVHFGYATNKAGDVNIAPLVEPRVTKRAAALVRVTLDTGESVRCTPDHLFRLRDGSYRRADALQPGDSLMPLYRNLSSKAGNKLTGYERVWMNAREQWVYTHDLADAFNVRHGLDSTKDQRSTRLRFERLLDHYEGDMACPRDAAANVNHSVVSVESLAERADVYDLTVEGYHNFALEAGVFVHNSARQGRNSEYQALLPLRGKILNVQKASLADMLKNAECAAIIQCIGAGSGRSFDISQMRYGRVLIMADADVDGSHIRTLLITLFHKYMRPVIEEGRLYAAMPPLHKIEVAGKGGETIYTYTAEEMERTVARIEKSGKKVKQPIQRYKGLGEMDAEELWETTMDPSLRSVRRISLEDAQAAERMLELLMGSAVEPRRDWLIANADRVDREAIDA